MFFLGLQKLLFGWSIENVFYSFLESRHQNIFNIKLIITFCLYINGMFSLEGLDFCFISYYSLRFFLDGFNFFIAGIIHKKC